MCPFIYSLLALSGPKCLQIRFCLVQPPQGGWQRAGPLWKWRPGVTLCCWPRAPLTAASPASWEGFSFLLCPQNGFLVEIWSLEEWHPVAAARGSVAVLGAGGAGQPLTFPVSSAPCPSRPSSEGRKPVGTRAEGTL